MIPLIALFLLPPSVGQADEQDIRVGQAVARSLNFLEKNGTEWMEKRGCVSCHTVGMMIWTHNEARKRGISVPAAKTRSWTDWTLLNLLARGKEAGGADTISQVILAREAADAWRKKPALVNKSVDPYENLWEALLAQQRPDGSWKPGPQLAAPAEVTTRWALLAIDSRDSTPALSPQGPLADLVKKLDTQVPESRKLAQNWFKEIPADEGLEARILRMLMMRKQEPALAQIWLLELLELQNADGGWAYQAGVKVSDAFATGLALYALGVQGHPRDHAQTRKAREFLLSTAKEEGSWLVKAASIRHVEEKENTAGADAIYSYWGTAWATLGLLWTLPPS